MTPTMKAMLVGAALVASAACAQDFSKIEVQTTKLTDSIKGVVFTVTSK